MGAKNFRELICWQLSRELRKTVNGLIKKQPLAADFDLCGQLRRATRSATGNIAEGFPCVSHAEFARYLGIAARSLSETEDRLIEALDERLLTEEEAAPALNLVKRASVATKRLIASLRPPPDNE